MPEISTPPCPPLILEGAGVSNFLIPQGIIPYCVQSYEIIPTYR